MVLLSKLILPIRGNKPFSRISLRNVIDICCEMFIVKEEQIFTRFHLNFRASLIFRLVQGSISRIKCLLYAHSINYGNHPADDLQNNSLNNDFLLSTLITHFCIKCEEKSFDREKGNCKKTWETYWAYYGKYARPSIQNTEPIC